MEIIKKVIQSDFQSVDETVREVLSVLQRQISPLKQETLFKINFMLREILNNAVEHGNLMQFEKKIYLAIAYDLPFISFEIKDEGAGFLLEHDDKTDHHIKHAKAYHTIKDNAAQELIKALNELGSEEIVKTRNRGFETLRLMNFSIVIDGNTVTTKLDLSQEEAS
jgi:anti-sigma regulatory factor (Ser/Thr protein kinase)